MAIGTLLGRIRIRGFALGATACILIVAVILGQLGTFVIPPVLRSILFGLFVFTIGYRSGPEFFASLSLRTLSQVVLALVIGVSGLVVVLVFAYPAASRCRHRGRARRRQPHAIVDDGHGVGRLAARPAGGPNQQQANIAAGYAVTYICGYILVLLFVPFVAPRLMGVNLKEEATKLEAELSGGAPREAEQPAYRKFQARAYRVSTAAGRTVGEIEAQIGRRAVVERILRDGAGRRAARPITVLRAGDEILLAGPTAAIVAAAPWSARRSRASTSCARFPATCSKYSSPRATCTAGPCARSSSGSATRRAAFSCAR